MQHGLSENETQKAGEKQIKLQKMRLSSQEERQKAERNQWEQAIFFKKKGGWVSHPPKVAWRSTPSRGTPPKSWSG